MAVWVDVVRALRANVCTYVCVPLASSFSVYLRVRVRACARTAFGAWPCGQEFSRERTYVFCFQTRYRRPVHKF